MLLLQNYHVKPFLESSNRFNIVVMTEKIIPNALFFAQIEESLQHGKSVRFKVNGVSMSPIIRNGEDSVTVVPISEWGMLELYNIILFKYNGVHILHRVIAISDNSTILTRGDGSYYAEEQCTLKEVVGVVSAIHRYGGKTINPNSSGYRLYARVWHGLPAFMRRFFLKVLRRLEP